MVSNCGRALTLCSALAPRARLAVPALVVAEVGVAAQNATAIDVALAARDVVLTAGTTLLAIAGAQRVVGVCIVVRTNRQKHSPTSTTFSTRTSDDFHASGAAAVMVALVGTAGCSGVVAATSGSPAMTIQAIVPYKSSKNDYSKLYLLP